jgi:hypothetical protein
VALQSSGSKNQENKGSKPDIGKYSRYPISKKNHKKRLAEWLKKRKRAKCVCSQMFVSKKKKKRLSENKGLEPGIGIHAYNPSTQKLR